MEWAFYLLVEAAVHGRRGPAGGEGAVVGVRGAAERGAGLGLRQTLEERGRTHDTGRDAEWGRQTGHMDLVHLQIGLIYIHTHIQNVHIYTHTYTQTLPLLCFICFQSRMLTTKFII